MLQIWGVCTEYSLKESRSNTGGLKLQDPHVITPTRTHERCPNPPFSYYSNPTSQIRFSLYQPCLSYRPPSRTQPSQIGIPTLNSRLSSVRWTMTTSKSDLTYWITCSVISQIPATESLITLGLRLQYPQRESLRLVHPPKNTSTNLIALTTLILNESSSYTMSTTFVISRVLF